MNSNIKTLSYDEAKAERRKVSAEIDSLLEKDILNELEENHYNTLMEYDGRLLNQMAAARNRSAAPPIKPDPDAWRGDDGRGYGYGSDIQNRITPITMRSKGNYQRLFPEIPLDNGGFDTAHEFLSVIASRRYDPRLAECRTGQTIGMGSSGGFLVPAQMSSQLLDLIVEENFMLSHGAQVFRMTGSELDCPLLADYDHSSSIAGLSALYKAEESALTTDQLNFEMVSFKAHKLTAYVTCSREFIDDAENGAATVMNAMSKTISWTMDRDFIRGNGSAMPLGYKNSNGKITVDATGGQGSNTLIWDNITDMETKIDPRAGKSYFLISPSCKAQVYEFSLAVGTGGSVVSWPVNAGPDGLSLLGHEVIWTEMADALGSEGDVILCAPTGYGVALRSDVRIDLSECALFSQDKVCFRAVIRYDGRPIHKSALTLRDGATQVADIVTLNSSRT